MNLTVLKAAEVPTPSHPGKLRLTFFTLSSIKVIHYLGHIIYTGGLNLKCLLRIQKIIYLTQVCLDISICIFNELF